MEKFEETNNKKKTFVNNLENIDLPKLGFVRDDKELYYIYKDAKEFIEIKATTAREALSLSDVEKPFMVVKVQNGNLSVVDENMLKNVEIEQSKGNQSEPQENQVPKDELKEKSDPKADSDPEPQTDEKPQEDEPDQKESQEDKD